MEDLYPSFSIQSNTTLVNHHTAMDARSYCSFDVVNRWSGRIPYHAWQLACLGSLPLLTEMRRFWPLNILPALLAPIRRCSPPSSNAPQIRDALSLETTHVFVDSKQQVQRITLSQGYMDILRLSTDEAAVRRYIEDLWIPYNRELEAIVDRFALADDVDLVAEELEYRLARHETESYRAWVAVDGSHDEGNLADIDGDFVGFITTDIDETSSVFDRPDRLVICDIYVRKPYRSTGLAHKLVDCAKTRARESGCAELTLEVDVDNERAIAFYEKLGFDPSRQTLVASVE